MINIYNRLVKYNNREIYIAFHTKTQEPYFNAKQVCELLDYNNIKQAIKIVSNLTIIYII